LRRNARPLFVAAVAFVLAETWVVASWSEWWYGGSFGMRPFVDAMPVFALGLAGLIETVQRTGTRRLLMSGIGITTLLSVHAMLAYWQKTISYDNTTLHEYFSSFRHL